MQTWTFKMNKKLTLIIFSGLLLSSCSWFSRGEGQVIYHWERENTGVEKFARDHSECMRKAENIRLPDFRTWFYSEEVKLDIRADWHAEKGIWASYIHGRNLEISEDGHKLLCMAVLRNRTLPCVLLFCWAIV